ncbi:MAG: 2-oxo acid dehydrogenase subunit E2 [Bacillus sp. (in: Bacteria)]|nr:2-oxo acid dehydrogenase subunit E2 [Bacillus sp. (in: firmicutes)]
MAVEVVMPKLGMAMKEGTVSIWNKEVGDMVGKGEPIASVNSEKIEIDVESPEEGMVLKIAVPEGEGVPPGTVICYIGNPGEEIGASDVFGDFKKLNKDAEEVIIIQNEPIMPTKTSLGRVKISPVARKMADAAKLDIENIQGTGPGGRITKEDIQEAMKETRELDTQPEVKQKKVVPQVQPQESKQVPVSGIRKVIGRRMHTSLLNSAQLTMNMKVDVTDLIALQKQTVETIQNRYQNKLTVTDFIALAVVLSLKQHPQMNSAYIDDKIHMFTPVHLGMAVALEKGLVVPVIRNAQTYTLVELSKNSKALAERARLGQLSNEEMQGSTFTISNLGAYGIEHFTPILNPPEAGILGVGAITDMPVYIGDIVQRRSMLPLSLTFDHRIIDGAPAAVFLKMVKQYLEEPITMIV